MLLITLMQRKNNKTNEYVTIAGTHYGAAVVTATNCLQPINQQSMTYNLTTLKKVL